MKKTTIALLSAIIVMASCKNDTVKNGFIPRQTVNIVDKKMTPEVLLALGRLSDPQLSPDGNRILYGVSYTNVGDNRSCRNLKLSDIDGKKQIQLTKYSNNVSNARWSLDGNYIFFIQGGQIWKAPIKGNRLGKKVKLTDIPSGINEFKLSPDQTKLIYLSTIKGPVTTPTDSDPSLDKAQAYVTEELMYRHWDHWVTETPRSYVASLNSLITPDNSRDILGNEPYELPTEPFGGAEQLAWSPDGRYIAYSCRKATGTEYAFSTDSEIYLYNVESGKTTVIQMGGGYDTDPVWSPDGTRLAWLSMERNGYEADKIRLMLADIDIEGETPSITDIRDLTTGFDRDASSPVWDQDGNTIWFNALTDGLQAIFTANAEYPGKIKRITPTDWWFDFFTPWAIIHKDGATRLLTTCYSLQAPLEIYSVTLSEDKCNYENISKENNHILSQLGENHSEKTIIETVDGKEMVTWILYPQDFDSSKQYPAIEILLGGPQGTLSQDWSYRWCYRLMAQQGYVVLMPNRRGTTSSGQEWKEQISGDYSGLNIQDYLTAGKWLKEKPYINKLAACGASYGGYSAYYLAGVHEDLYDCFIAHAGIFNEEELYYTTEEMWFANWDNGGLTEYRYTPGLIGAQGDGITFGGMQQAGSPWSNKEKTRHHYANSPHFNVQNWHTPILCIHGGMDFRIPYEQGMAAFNSARMMGVPAKLVVFPTENHWILQPQNALFWHRTYFDWLSRWLQSDD